MELIAVVKHFDPFKDDRPGFIALYARGMTRQHLDAFAAGKWGQKYPTIVASWRRAWEQVIPFFAYPLEVRRVIYTSCIHS